MVKFENERQRSEHLTNIFREVNFKRDREGHQIFGGQSLPRSPLPISSTSSSSSSSSLIRGEKQNKNDIKSWKRGTWPCDYVLSSNSDINSNHHRNQRKIPLLYVFTVLTDSARYCNAQHSSPFDATEHTWQRDYNTSNIRTHVLISISHVNFLYTRNMTCKKPEWLYLGDLLYWV